MKVGASLSRPGLCKGPAGDFRNPNGVTTVAVLWGGRWLPSVPRTQVLCAVLVCFTGGRTGRDRAGAGRDLSRTGRANGRRRMAGGSLLQSSCRSGALRNHSWWPGGHYMGCLGPNLGPCCARQAGLPLYSGPHLSAISGALSAISPCHSPGPRELLLGKGKCRHLCAAWAGPAL